MRRWDETEERLADVRDRARKRAVEELREKAKDATEARTPHRVTRKLPWRRPWWKILLSPWWGTRRRLVLTTIGAIDLHDRLQVVWVHVDRTVRGWVTRSHAWTGWRVMGERGQPEAKRLGDVRDLDVAVVLAGGSRGSGAMVPHPVALSAVEELEAMEVVPCTSD